jgi:hypothetical protein
LTALKQLKPKLQEAQRMSERLIEVDDINSMLADRMEEVIAALGIEGKVRGGRFEAMAPWPHSDKSEKLSIALRKTPGAWIHWTSGFKGNAFDLVAAVLHGGGSKDRKRAYAWSLNFLGLQTPRNESEQARQVRLDTHQRQVAAAKQAQMERQAKERKKLEGDRARAKALWLEAARLAPSDPVWKYLAARGIDLAKFPRLPGAIKVLASHDHTCEQSGEVTTWPCMISAMTLPDGSFGGIHRTWIDPDRPGKKALVTGSRKMWPSVIGSAIRLSRGQSGKPHAQVPDNSDLVVVCEGIEDGLSIAMRQPQARVEAAGALSLLLHYQPLPCTRELRIAADRDWDKPQAMQLLDDACARLARMLAPKPVGRIYAPAPFKDFNEALMAARGLS